MISRRRPETTVSFGAPVDWDHGTAPCDALWVEVGELAPGLPVLSSCWGPTPAESRLLNAGGHVRSTIVGTVHPPVALGVVEEPAG